MSAHRLLRSSSPRLCSIETLEDRIAPANFVSPTLVTYTDVDGDEVRITTTKGYFSPDDFVFTPLGFGEQLRRIELSGKTSFQGASISVVATQAGGGDGFVNVGWVDAAGIDLARLTIDGDLGRMTIGDTIAKTPAAGSIKLHSIGVQGTATQEAGGNLVSTLVGGVGTLYLASDFREATLFVQGGPFGKIGTLTINGNILGADTEVNSGAIFAEGNMGAIRVGGSIVGAGGGATNSGRIDSGGSIGSIHVGGNLIGGGGNESGVIRASGNLGPVFIGGDVQGSTGSSSGLIETDNGGNIASVTIKGGLKGSTGASSGKIQTDRGGRIGPVTIGTLGGTGVITGGAGSESGSIVADDGGSIVSVTVFGSVVGGGGDDSGSIEVANSGNIGRVKITGSLIGGAGDDSGAILIGDNGSIGSVQIGGLMVGSSGTNSGSIQTNDVGNIGSVRVTSVIVGSTGSHSGSIQAPRGSIGTVIAGNSMVGGPGADSGSIVASGNVDLVVVSGGGNLIGGTGSESGSIISRNGDIGSVKIVGDLRGANGAAPVVVDSGTIQAELGTVRSVVINGDLIGGSTAAGTAVNGSGAILGENVGKVVIRGDLTAGSSAGIFTVNSGAIRADHQLRSLTVLGNVLGTSANHVMITGVGQVAPGAGTDVAIGTVAIGGDAFYVDILGGYNSLSTAVNPDAQIRMVHVGGNWRGGNIAAGVARVDAYFGNANDARIPEPDLDTSIISRISAIIIDGTVDATPAIGDIFGFVAEEVRLLKIAGHIVAHNPGAHNDTMPVGLGMGSDTRLLEVP